MDPREVSWVRGFLLEHPIEEWLAKEILLCLPNPQLLDPRLKKALLLRRLSFDVSSDRLSEDTLRSLELLEELDRSLGAASPPKALVAAYCAVAAELTLSPLRDPRSKVSAEADFFEAVNRIWNCRVVDVERSVARGLVGEGLMRWRTAIKEALGSAAARERLLRWNTGWEAAASLREYLRVALKEMGPQLLELVARAVIDDEEEEEEEEEAVDAKPSNSGVCQEAVERKEQSLDEGPSDARGGDEPVEISGGGLDVEPSKESLEQSTSAETERTAALAEQASPDASMDEDHRSKELGLVSSPEEDENAVQSPSGKSSSCSRGAHLATPRRRRVPSLRLQEIAKFVRTRKIKRWTPQEEDALREAVKKHGKGNWKIILHSHREAFEERTEVDLKDKWRNMTR
ncbi:unnamed protein product [Spirodela intermedia]|uniref:Uncharacterized protein n=1 Tax=Spirodela intermedia TaxID=51605 RepID=A0A7I8JVG5_SPIIN|nr:unnamed protein product [Spirodela intermedia]